MIKFNLCFCNLEFLDLVELSWRDILRDYVQCREKRSNEQMNEELELVLWFIWGNRTPGGIKENVLGLASWKHFAIFNQAKAI